MTVEPRTLRLPFPEKAFGPKGLLMGGLALMAVPLTVSAAIASGGEPLLLVVVPFVLAAGLFIASNMVVGSARLDVVEFEVGGGTVKARFRTPFLRMSSSRAIPDGSALVVRLRKHSWLMPYRPSRASLVVLVAGKVVAGTSVSWPRETEIWANWATEMRGKLADIGAPMEVRCEEASYFSAV